MVRSFIFQFTHSNSNQFFNGNFRTVTPNRVKKKTESLLFYSIVRGLGLNPHQMQIEQFHSHLNVIFFTMELSFSLTHSLILL